MRRSARLLAALGATVLVAAVSGAPAGAARRSEAYAVSGPSTITLTGHGFGHGHGMSQYGAEGAARQGMTWQQIIGFYYPGTSWGELRGRISVLLTGDTTDDVVVLAQPGLSVTRLTPRKAWTLPANGARQWRINPLTGGRSQVQFARTGGWRTWKVFRGDAELSAANKRLTLVTPSGSRTYRGRLRSASPVPGGTARDTVNVLSMEAYLRGVVPLEIPASWSPDAVRAQAVAARTYAAAERSHPNARHYQICDTTSCQVYGGMGAEHPAATQAVRDTARQGLTYDGRPAFTQFSASSGGWTSAGSAPYLVAQVDPYDGWDGNGVHDWTRTVGDAVLERHFPAIGDLTSIEIGARDGYGDWGGRVQAMTLVGTRGRATTTGDTLRTLLGLRSSWFTVSVAPLTARPKA